MSLKCGLLGVGFLAGALAFGSNAQAGSLVLGNSGWRASWSSSFDNADYTYVTLTVLAETDSTVVIQKTAVFADGPDQHGLIAPIEINFEQTRADAAKNIVVTSESVTNASGVDWNSFQFIIEDGTTDTSADTSFDITRTFGSVPPFDVSPFSVVGVGGITSQPQIITLGDGVLANGEIWRPGVGPAGGELVIHAAPATDGSKRFVFKELPGGEVIPLPAAAWMGLSSLLGLGAVGAVRKARRTIA
ncbi:MAG: VPLPA-CTERM sorting domain-containing protein [Phycisphaerales bacterium]|jgi:hypothetical protein|nr:VPLPA-CTERM sorting domain-containing protein [Phycisphaerales bacterium]